MASDCDTSCTVEEASPRADLVLGGALVAAGCLESRRGRRSYGLVGHDLAGVLTLACTTAISLREDLKTAERDELVKRHGYNVFHHHE
jgi:hypothetical protein